MEDWRDQGIVLSARPHGEGGAVVTLLTAAHGRHAGYVYGASSAASRAVLQPGAIVSAQWRARTTDQLGTFALEAERALPGAILLDTLRLSALLSACALCEIALPERELHPGLYHGMEALLEALSGPHWGPVYVTWELAFLKELGFGLDLSRCAASGDTSDLVYVSPRTGRAVSRKAGEPYRDRLLPLPDFLSTPRGPDAGSDADCLKGLGLAGHFLEHWAFAHHTRGMPEPRLRFVARFAKTVEQTSIGSAA